MNYLICFEGNVNINAHNYKINYKDNVNILES